MINFFNDKKIVAIYLGKVGVNSTGNTVTYNIDENSSNQLDVVGGINVLTLMNPTKAGYTFVGWREDNTASADVLTSKTMGSEPITLYAVFKKNYTLNAVSYNSTQKVTGELYYNNGNITDPTVTIPTGASYSGHTWRGWSGNGATTANASVSYVNGSSITLRSDMTIYGLYQKEITITYYNNSSTASTTKGTRYYNAAGDSTNPSFTLSQASVSGWTARGWSTGTAGNSGVTYNNATAFTRDSNVTLYGTYQKTVTLSYNGNGNTSGSTSSHSATAYRNYAGTIVNASFTLKSSEFTKTSHAFSKWAQGSASGTQYAAGATVGISSNTTFYAVWTLSAVSYYPTFKNASLWHQDDCTDNSATPFGVDSNCVWVSAQNAEQMTDFATSVYSATFNTNQCNKVRISARSWCGERGDTGNIFVNGVGQRVPETSTQLYYNIDPNSSTFTVTLNSVNASSYYSLDVQLYEIYVYYEA